MRSLWEMPEGFGKGNNHYHKRRWNEGDAVGPVDMVVVGAGLAGMATAVMAAQRGLKVVVLEGRHLGAGTTGRSTAKVSLLQGTVLSDIRSHQGDKVAHDYVEANRFGAHWLRDVCVRHDLQWQERPAYTYAQGEEGVGQLRKEFEAEQAAKLGSEFLEHDELPAEARDIMGAQAAIRLAAQFQVNPREVLVHLAKDLTGSGGQLIEGARVVDVKADGDDRVVTVEVTGLEDAFEEGNHATGRGFTLRCSDVVLATGSPILDRSGYFAQLEPYRSYIGAYHGATGRPEGMYLGIDGGPSVRTADIDGREYLLVGGNSHVVGRTESETEGWKKYREWAGRHFPEAVATAEWSAQDYRAHDMVPHAGPIPGDEHILVATGFNKWGFTNAVAAAAMVIGSITGEQHAWAKPFLSRHAGLADVAQAAKLNASVAGHLAVDWVKAMLHGPDGKDLLPGEGKVVRHGKNPVGISRDENGTHVVSAVCPHLGGILKWNDFECTWDCPLHASRFTATGERIEGPAVKDLTKYKK